MSFIINSRPTHKANPFYYSLIRTSAEWRGNVFLLLPTGSQAAVRLGGLVAWWLGGLEGLSSISIHPVLYVRAMDRHPSTDEARAAAIRPNHRAMEWWLLIPASTYGTLTSLYIAEGVPRAIVVACSCRFETLLDFDYVKILRYHAR
jgi:hypothetical protein